MDWNVYALEKLVAMRLKEARARSVQASLVASLRPRRAAALAVVGLGLLKLGGGVQRGGGGRRRAARPPALRMLGSRHV